MPLPSDTLTRLRKIVGPENVLTSKEDLIAYSFDGTAAMQQLPGAVVFATTTEQVAQILKLANQTKTPVVTRGSGTGLSGGSLPSARIASCSALVKMNRILEVDRANLTMLVEPGVTTLRSPMRRRGRPVLSARSRLDEDLHHRRQRGGELRRLARPQVRHHAQLRHGPRGRPARRRILWTGNKCVKDVAGYSLRDLFIGSEGTLGVITKVLLRLIPNPPPRKPWSPRSRRWTPRRRRSRTSSPRRSFPARWSSWTARPFIAWRIYAEIGLPLDCEALLLMETDGHPPPWRRKPRRWKNRPQNGCREVRVAKDDAEANKLATARRSAFSALARVAPTTILEDATVPRSELARMVRFVEEVAKKYNLRVGTFGHMGDGNLHPTFLTDERNHEEMHRVEEAFKEIFDEAIRLGGTITGEHGVGVAKKDFLPKFAGDAQMRVMRELRRALDPERHPEPRERCSIPSQIPRLLRRAAVHALRPVPADVSDLRRHQAGAQ
jgi:glycolate oxidase